MAEVPLAAGVAPPAPPAPPAPRSGDEILMAFAGPAPQRRVTVLFRLLLAIPQLIVLYVLSIVAELVAVVGWFAALFTGRLPGGLAASCRLASLERPCRLLPGPADRPVPAVRDG